MKRINYQTSVISLLLVVGAGLLIALPAAAQKPDVALAGLHGKVKSVKTCTYSATERFGEIAKGAPVGECFEWYYNEQGYKTESRNISDWLIGSNITPAKVIYKYDASGHLAEAFHYYEDGKLSEKTVYERTVNDNGSVSVMLTDADGGGIDGLYSYYDDGDLYGESASGIDWRYYYYDGNNRRIRAYDYGYDDNGKYAPFRMVGYDEYNDKDDCVRQYTDQLQNYDEWREEHKNESGAVITFEINGVKYAITESDVKYYSYVYDAHGNWTQRILLQGEAKTPRTIVEREIKYY
jgi:hypothetical protein